MHIYVYIYIYTSSVSEITGMEGGIVIIHGEGSRAENEKRRNRKRWRNERGKGRKEGNLHWVWMAEG